MTTETAPVTPARGSRLVAADGRTLPLRSTRLHVLAGAGLARTQLEQRFVNPWPEPLTASYQLPLPADGAVAAFTFVVGERRIVGEIEGREAARERFEQALAEGRSGALVEQDRTALFAQQIGNIPPGCEVVVELLVDQPLAWWCGEWEYRFPTTVAPRYLGAEGRVPDAVRIATDVADAPLPVRLHLDLGIDDDFADATSPSHELRRDGARVLLPAEGVPLDRDVVVRWRVPAPQVGAVLRTARPAAEEPHGDVGYGLLALVPPASAAPSLPRDLTVLLDTSGSMSGEPLHQAKSVVAALLGGLTDRDQLQLIEFSTEPRRWRRGPVRASAAEREAALRWLHGLQASGGTEMLTAVLESLRSVRYGAQSQVLLVTDGLIGFEQEIVRALLQQLPENCRFHVLGVGAACNRALSCAAARAGRGAEAIVGLGEDPGAAARRLDGRMRAPVVVGLELSGTALLGAAPERLPDLFAGEPARVSLRLRPQGGTLDMRGATANGTFAHRLEVPAIAPSSGRAEVVTRCGRELVEDLEMRVAAGLGRGTDEQIEQLGRRFRLATRRTSWVAISTEATVDPRSPVRRERIPHELPHGLSAEGLGLRSACQMLRPSAWEPIHASRPRWRGVGEALWEMVKRGVLPEGLRERSELRQPWVRIWRPAKLTWHRDGWLALELSLEDDAWELPAEVLLHWPGRIVLRGVADSARSTRSGPVPKGTVVRLVLLLPAAAPAADPIAVELHGARLGVIRDP
ncbi:MAG TPA: VIT domain-containing protein [Planctomycetota bacterium]